MDRNDSQFNDAMDRNDGEFVAALKLVGLAFLWVFRTVGDGFQSTFFALRLTSRRIPKRCGQCKAQIWRSESCQVCGGTDWVRPPYLLKLGLPINDWGPKILRWLAALTLVAPVLISTFLFATFLVSSFSDARGSRSWELSIATGILYLLLVPIVFFGLWVLLLNLVAWTAKKILFDWEELVENTGAFLRFLLLSVTQIGTVFVAMAAFFANSNAGYQTWLWVLVFPQIALVIGAITVIVMRTLVRRPFFHVLDAAFIADLLTNSRTIGRPGSSLDQADLSSANIQRGQTGEQIFSAAIAGLTGKFDLTLMFNSLRVPGMSNADMDHVLVTGDSIMIIDAKNWGAGDYEVVQGNVWKDGQPFDGGSVNIEAFRAALQDHLRHKISVEARVVMIQENSKVNGETRLSEKATLTTLGKFLDDYTQMPKEAEVMPSASLVSALLDLSSDPQKPDDLADRLVAADLNLVTKYLFNTVQAR